LPGKIEDPVRRASQGIRGMFTRPRLPYPENRESRENAARRWNILCAKYMQVGLESEECRRRAMLNLACPPIIAPADAHKQKDDEQPIVGAFSFYGPFLPVFSPKNYIHRTGHAHKIAGPDFFHCLKNKCRIVALYVSHIKPIGKKIRR
jgi:hypothetical protein